MRDRTFERIGALSGLAFFILAVLSGFIYPQQPRVDSAPVKTLAWVHDHHAALQAGMIFDFFAAGVLLWFAGYLYRVLRHAEGEQATFARSSSPRASACPSPARSLRCPRCCSPSWMPNPAASRPVTRAPLGDLNTIFFSATSVMTAVFTAALGWAMLRGELGTRWLGWLALVVAIFNCISVWIGVTFSSYHGHAWLIIGWGSYVGFLVVMLILSVVMLRQPRAATSIPAAAPAVVVQ